MGEKERVHVREVAHGQVIHLLVAARHRDIISVSQSCLLVLLMRHRLVKLVIRLVICGATIKWNKLLMVARFYWNSPKIVTSTKVIATIIDMVLLLRINLVILARLLLC